MDKFDYFKDDLNTDVAKDEPFDLFGKADGEKAKDGLQKNDPSARTFSTASSSAFDSFVQPTDSIRTTYIPRFTEVSETYRMKDDPRPRPKTDTHNVKATKETGIKQVAIAGGVSANSGLQNAMHENGKRYGWEVFIPKFKFSTDNAAMIGIAGYFKYKRGMFATQDQTPYARTTTQK